MNKFLSFITIFLAALLSITENGFAQSKFGPANLSKAGLPNDGITTRIVPSSYYSPTTDNLKPNQISTSGYVQPWSCTNYYDDGSYTFGTPSGLFVPATATTVKNPPFSGVNATTGYGGMTSTWNSSQYLAYSLQFQEVNFTYTQLDFRVLLPQGYNQNNAKKYPLIVFLNGAGESGGQIYKSSIAGIYQFDQCDVRCRNNEAPLTVGGQYHLDLINGTNVVLKNTTAITKQADAIVIFPQTMDTWVDGAQFSTSGNYIWDGQTNPPGSGQKQTKLLIQMIEELVGGKTATDGLKLNIDPNRVYLEGASQGGSGVWDLLMRRPDLFAGAIPMSSGGPTNTTNGSSNLSRISYTGIWYWQGGMDTNPTSGNGIQSIIDLQAQSVSGIKRDKNVVDVTNNSNGNNDWLNGTATNSYSGNKRYIVESNEGHNVFSDCYKHPDYFRWLFAQSKLNIVAFSDTMLSATNTSIKIGVQPGYAAYEWRYSTDNINYTGNIPGGLANTTNEMTVATPGYYKVRFQRTNLGWTEFSQSIRILNSGSDVTPPTAPDSLVVIGGSLNSNSFVISWKAPNNSDIQGYDIYINGQKYNTETITGTSAVVSGLNPSTSYSIVVKAKDTSGNISGASVTINASTTNTTGECLNNELYYQNMTFTTRIKTAKTFVKMGNNVTSSVAAGNVTIPNGINVVLKAGNDIYIQPGFSANNGSMVQLAIESSSTPACNTQTATNLKTVEAKSKEAEVAEETNTGIVLFPNPARGVVNISLNRDDVFQDSFVLTIHDMLGNKVCSYSEKELTKRQNKVDLSNRPSGIYVATFSDGKQIIRKRFVLSN